jgi:cell division protein FtsL
MSREFRLASFFLACFVVAAALHLFILTQNSDLKNQLTDIKVKLNELKSQNRLLSSQVAAGENLGLVEKLATSRLKMVYPAKINYLVVSREAAPPSPTP